MKKTLRLIKKLCLEFIALGKTYSWRYAFYNLTWWLCFYVRTRYTWRISQWALKKKTVWLDSYFEKKMNAINEMSYDHKRLSTADFKIWVFWGQGEASMPPLVKACYRQLTRFNKNVLLITFDNVGDYIDLPEKVYHKVLNGKLSWAHFSDIIRTSLLAKYGGLWLDATVWVSGTLPIDKILEMPFWSANYKSEHVPTDVCFWTSGDWNWSTWCMSANHTHSELFSFVSSMMLKVACEKQVWPDYVFQDYLIHFACRQSETIRHEMESMTINNPKRNELATIVGLEYKEDIYSGLLTTDFVFKLSFRVISKKEISGNQTFYGKLISGTL